MKILDRIVDYPRQRRIQKIKNEYPIDLQDYTGVEITICAPPNIIISMVKEEEALAPRLLKCKKALLDMLEPIKSVPGVEYRPLDNLILEGLSETIKKALTAYIKKKEILK